MLDIHPVVDYATRRCAVPSLYHSKKWSSANRVAIQMIIEGQSFNWHQPRRRN